MAIVDNTITGKADENQFYGIAKTFPKLQFKTLNTSQLTKREIETQLKKLDKHTILLFLLFSEDADGNIYPYIKAIETIYHASPIPIYKLDETGIGDGIFGGCVISLSDMGKTAAKMALKIINGTKPAAIKTTAMSYTNLYDASLLKQYGYQKTDFPAHTQFINTDSKINQYEEILIPSLVTLATGFIIIMLITSNLNNRRITKVNKDLQTALISADNANQAKMDFFSEINHDMRTPLNAVINYAELAKKEDINENTKVYLDKIKTSGNILLALINDTLTISKINSGKLILHPQPTYISDLYKQTIIPIQSIAESKHITFTVDESALDNVAVEADRLNIGKVLLNLLSNAVKYTDEGGKVDFIVSNQKYSTNQQVVTFIIADSGIGISDTFLPHIFEPFVQASIQSEINGTGLGLAIEKQLVDMMNGTIRVESKLGVGTTFTLQFKLTTSQAKVESISNDLSQSNYLNKLRGTKFLVCEDNEMNMEIIKSLLKQYGISVVGAPNGKRGLEIFNASYKYEFYAILMDIRMPVMDGYETATRIRAMARVEGRLIPIVALTADAFAEDEKKCQESGMDAHVAKPVNVEQLLKKIYAIKQHKGTTE